MSYTASITITVPAALYSVACAVARALDPDVGGAESFGPECEDATEYTTTTPCVPAFAAQAIGRRSRQTLRSAAWPDCSPSP